ncbi:DUF4167 domain-containing protein [Methylocystis sp. JAN1]|uniref:DUF4167 domain-containing protein n=1 Tax=Methylocystis sp. JAN1 TaxID=3397211 RepID=UPI003FA2FECB
MRPGQNKRMRGRSGRKGPNPLTRSYESNGPDVKIRGTAQHIAEKYLQLARDAQSSGDTIMAESLLQHAEHYFRLIAAAQVAQQQANGFGRPQVEAEVEMEDDDDFAALPDRFAPLSERLPQPVYQAQPQPFMPQPQPQPHFTQPQPQPQPYEERPIGEMRVDMRGERGERMERGERPPRPERPPFRERNPDSDQPRRFERNRDRRFQRPEANDEAAPSLPSFITAPPARPVVAEAEAPETGFSPSAERQPAREHEGVNFHLSSRRRRRPARAQLEEPAGDTREEAPAPSESPFEPDRF